MKPIISIRITSEDGQTVLGTFNRHHGVPMNLGKPLSERCWFLNDPSSRRAARHSADGEGRRWGGPADMKRAWRPGLITEQRLVDDSPNHGPPHEADRVVFDIVHDRQRPPWRVREETLSPMLTALADAGYRAVSWKTLRVLSCRGG